MLKLQLPVTPTYVTHNASANRRRCKKQASMLLLLPASSLPLLLLD